MKKRSKKLLTFKVHLSDQRDLKMQKFFGSFFQKRTPSRPIIRRRRNPTNYQPKPLAADGVGDTLRALAHLHKTHITHIIVESGSRAIEIFTSLELQQRTGDVQRASARVPVLLTSHGKPSRVILSAEEYARLKRAAGEPVPPEILPPRARTIRGASDPLGYDTTDQVAAVARMLADIEAGRTQAAVRDELSRVRAAWGRG